MRPGISGQKRWDSSCAWNSRWVLTGNGGHPSVILCTGDLENAHREMKERGVRTGDIMKMPYGSMFQFYDMDGNVFLLREEARVH